MRVDVPTDDLGCATFYDSTGRHIAFMTASRRGHLGIAAILSFQGERAPFHDVRLNGECPCGRWHRWLIEAAIEAGWEYHHPA